MSRTEYLTDAQWSLIEPLLPSSDGRRGRPFRDNRRVVEGIVYRYRAGIAWRDLPAEFGPWQTIWKRHRRYAGDGTWDRVMAALLAHADANGLVDWAVSVDSTICRAHQHAPTSRGTQGDLSNYTNLLAEPADHALGRSRGGLGTKIHQVSDGNGRPLVLLIGPGQAGDSPMFPILMQALSVPRVGPGRPRTRPDAVLGDKAYSSKSNRALLRSRGIEAVIAEPDDQRRNRLRRGSRGGRPVRFDADKYKGRNVVERSFAGIKQWRGLATRYDKLALTYRAGVLLSAVCAWLKHLAN
ncbi:IS5 family transposase [Rhodococcus zopfii]|uniref:IS5 family transposase n=1 Tax=Rhodococcus zopfii TaxID=43772 RepID=UPI0024680F1F|nr:IS5 family transposase [Rhodococcus zopfii]